MDAWWESLTAVRVRTEDMVRWRIGGRIAYVLGHALPFSSNGDAVRSHGLALGLATHGFEVCALTRPGYPWFLPGFVGPYAANQHTLEGIRYIHPDRQPDCGESQTKADADIYAKWFRLFKPSAVLATSEPGSALPALLASRQTGLPFIYEARELADADNAAVAQAADCVVTLGQQMAEELVRRGVAHGKISIVPHALPSLPRLPAKNMRLARRLGLNRCRVVAYIGSLAPCEGLDDLLAACALLRRQGLAVKLLIVGASNSLVQAEADDPALDRLQGVAQTLGLAGHVVFRGRVSHAEIGHYYALADVVALPRRLGPSAPWALPLKAVEALACGRPLVVSAAGPLAELAEEARLGIGFRAGDCDELAVALRLALEDDVWRRESCAQSRRWVAEQRLWEAVAKPLVAQLRQIGVEPVAPPASAQLPVGAGKLRVAAVMDEFSELAFAPECELLQIRPDTWQAQIAAFKPDLLFIESAWKGVDGLWHGKVALDRQVLAAAVDWCKSQRIPTLFWNKEDPFYFESLLATAGLFDFVFTTDIDCVPRYKRALGHDRVFLLPFACQPTLHNPIEKYARKDAFCFAGAYYAYFAERTRDLGHLVPQLAEIRPVEIFDRYRSQDDNISHRFPPEYQPHIVGALPFGQIDQAYKGYRYALNLNSIKQSQSMFSRRAYELLASNTLTVSNFSRGLRLFFGDLVISSDDGAEILRRLRPLTDDGEAAGKLRLAGLRKVMLEHTYAHRLAYAAGKALGRPVGLPLPPILVLARASNRAELDALLGHWRRQRYADMRLLIIADAALAGQMPADPCAAHLPLSALAGKALGDIIGGAQWLAGLVAGDYYGPYYLLDIALATRYSKASAIGKRGRYEFSGQGVALCEAECVYRHSGELPARSAAVDCGQVAGEDALVWLESLPHRAYRMDGALAIDPYHYCRDAGTAPSAAIAARVDGSDLYAGLEVCAAQERAEAAGARQRLPGWPRRVGQAKTHPPGFDGGQASAVLEQAGYLLV
ncbi:MAG: glycosyltransferase, partial [Candidatus Methylumidiphilus sp.]